MRERLYTDALNEEILRKTEFRDKEQVLNGEKQYEIKIGAGYKEKKSKYEEILSAMGEYFELFKKNTERLEDLFL